MPRLFTPQTEQKLCFVIPILVAILLTSPQFTGAKVATFSPVACIFLGFLFFMFFLSLWRLQILIRNNLNFVFELPTKGLDPKILDTFPVMKYGEVKKHKKIEGELMCAICQHEFEDDTNIMLLPHCSHVFRKECIEHWLKKNVCCPLCRADLSTPVSVDDIFEVQEEVIEEKVLQPAAKVQHRRSHSMGYIDVRENMDLYTLKLPKSVWKHLLTKHRRTKSLTIVPVDGEARRLKYWRSNSGGNRSQKSERPDWWEFEEQLSPVNETEERTPRPRDGGL